MDDFDLKQDLKAEFEALQKELSSTKIENSRLKEVIIDNDAFPDYEEDEKVKTYYSRTEAYQEMMKINPKFAEFVKTFDLKLDENN